MSRDGIRRGGGRNRSLRRGYSGAVLIEAQQSRIDAATVVRQLDQVEQHIVNLQARDRQRCLSARGGLELDRFHQIYRSLLEQRAKFVQRQAELAELLQALRNAAVVVQGTCHAEVRVTIGTMAYIVREAWHGVRFERNLDKHSIELIGLADAHL